MVIPAALAVAGTKAALAAKGFLAQHGSNILNGLSGLGNFGKLGNMFGSGSAKKAAEQQYQYNLALQKQAQRWNEKMYKHRYQWQVEDLESAGINKLYGLGTAPMTSSGTNSVGMPDYVGEQNNKMQQIFSAIEAGQNYSAKKAQTRLIENQANTEAINTGLKTLETYTQQLENLERQIRLKYLDQKERLDIQKQISEIKQNMASTRKYIAETQSIQYDNLPKQRREEFIKDNPKLGKILEGMNSNKELIGTGLAIGAGAIGLGNLARLNFFKRKVGF